MSTKRLLYAFRRGRTRHTCVAYGVAFNPNLGLKRDSANTTKQLRRKRQKNELGVEGPAPPSGLRLWAGTPPGGLPDPSSCPGGCTLCTKKLGFKKLAVAPPSGLAREVGGSPGGPPTPVSCPDGCASCNNNADCTELWVKQLVEFCNEDACKATNL